MQSPTLDKSARRRAGRKSGALPWLYVLTLVGFVFVAGMLIYAGQKFNAESVAIQTQTKAISEQQVLSERLKTLATEHWFPGADMNDLEDRQSETTQQMKAVLARLEMLSESPELAARAEQIAETNSTLKRLNSEIRAAAADSSGPASDIGLHIASFVAHYLSAFDLTFDRPNKNDVILLALTSDPKAMVERLLTKNREEMRLSPGSTVDVSFEVLHRWNINEDPSNIAETFVALFGHEFAEQSNESQENPYRR